MNLRRNSKIMSRGILRANSLEAERDENLEKWEMPTQRQRRVRSFCADGKNTDRGSNLPVKRHTAFPQTIVSSSSGGSVQAQNRKVHTLPSPLFPWRFFHSRRKRWKWAWSGLYREAEEHWLDGVCVPLLSCPLFFSTLLFALWGWPGWIISVDFSASCFLLVLAHGDLWWEVTGQ